MSLLGFQRALADMVASPQLARAVLAGEPGALDPYELTDRERRRLETVVAQPGMDVNCTLYRANRLTPVVLLLPYSCFVLGDRMKGLAERFWQDSRTDLQFRSETERFAAFLRGLVRAGELEEPLLEEVLDFELASNELRFAPRRQLDERASASRGTRPRLHPLVRVVWFRHDPEELLERLAATEPPPYDLPEGDFPVLLVAGPDELQVRRVDRKLALLLERLDDTAEIDDEDARLLVEERLAYLA